MIIKVKCPSCKKNVAVNPKKHLNDDYIKCSFCHTTVKNEFKDPNFKPNTEFRRGKPVSRPFTIESMRGIMRAAVQGARGIRAHTIPTMQPAQKEDE